MKKSTIILFTVGLVLEIIAFPLSHSEKIPWILKIVAPSYLNAQKGYKKIKSEKVLLPGEKGFAEISETLLSKVKNHEILNTIHIEKIIFEDNWSIISGSQKLADNNRIVTVFSNGQKVNISPEGLKTQIEDIRSNKIFQFSVGLFMFGIILQIIGFVCKNRNKSSNKTIQRLEPPALQAVGPSR